MNTSFLFGRYYPSNSPLHRMDPRAKLVLVLLGTTAVFCALPINFWGLGICTCFILAFSIASDISISALAKSITPLSFIVVITALLNLFFIQGGTVYFSWMGISISEAGILQAAFISWRLVLLLQLMSLLTLTTTTLDLTDAFERLFAPLKRLGIPVHELSMMMGIALRFLPLFVIEIKTIYRAQLSRGSAVNQGRVRSIVALVIPLFTSAFRHAETLSYAMDARCYQGGEKRERLRPLAFHLNDAIGTIVVLTMLVLTITSNTIR